VSQEVRTRQLSEIPETRMAVFILINLGVPDELINRAYRVVAKQICTIRSRGFF
jgi:hypothetical protein